MKILSYADLKSQKGISYSKVQLWRLEKQNKFPKRLQLGPGRHGWLESELNDWIMVRVAERDTAGGLGTQAISEQKPQPSGPGNGRIVR